MGCAALQRWQGFALGMFRVSLLILRFLLPTAAAIVTDAPL